ncbi:MAG: UDP-N-acetylglucosamine 2-epimerase (non-hydrolyzing) [Deltaproteobacteria bacterium]|nr:UDP-N-acetylglucosamine 2-epimerase (non-hydrolyzing) [Deltaproteobacteria bacterium]
MRRIMVAVGTRPEAIKMAPVVTTLAEADVGFEVRLCLTGQHRQMLDQALSVFDLKADTDLNLMRPNQDLSSLTAAVLESMKSVLAEAKPDLVLVQGDTTTTFAVALAAFYARIPVGHVEAGLRTWDMAAPYPEEANRCLTTVLTALHFPPTIGAKENLLRSQVPADRIFVTGNTVIDALLRTARRLESDEALATRVRSAFPFIRPDARLVLITGHRRESFGEGFDHICQGIQRAAVRFPDTDFVYPVHLNPNVREPVFRQLGARSNVHLIEPVDYLAIVWLMQRAHLVLTDSGGIQEEAPSLGKPVLVMREKTERPEGVEANTSRLVGTSADRIFEGISALMEDRSMYEAMSHASNPYGDGTASLQILSALQRWFDVA